VIGLRGKVLDDGIMGRVGSEITSEPLAPQVMNASLRVAS